MIILSGPGAGVKFSLCILLKKFFSFLGRKPIDAVYSTIVE